MVRSPIRPPVPPLTGRVEVNALALLANCFALDLEMPQMRHRLAGGQAERAVVDLAAEQDREAVERAARLGKEFVKRVEPAAMAGGESIEPRVEPEEGLAVRGQDEQVVGKLLEPGDRGQPLA